jgi:preprotein translocase subunit SecD
MSIRNRLLLIGLLVVASAYALYPRTIEQRIRQEDGSYRIDTITKVPIRYGLDLSGGMHLALEVDESEGTVANKEDAIDRALKVVRTRIDEFGVAEPVVQKVGTDRIIVELPGIDDRERAEQLVKRSAFLQFQMTDETRALERALPRIDRILRESGEATRVATVAGDTGTRQALDQLFTTDTTDTAGVADSASADTALALGADGALSSLIQPTQMPGEFVVAEEQIATVRRYFSLPQVQAALPPGKVVRFGAEEDAATAAGYRPFYVLDARPIITGEYLTDARPTQDPVEGNVVTFELNNQGGRRFRAETQRHIGDYMAIVLDDIVVGQPPVIRSAIGTRGQITMTGKPLQAAQDLALVLRAGALPVRLKVVESRTIGPSLGEDSIVAGQRAGILGITLVVLVMLVYYRFAGMLAVGALVLYALFTLAILSGFDAVLTLPGLAGFVLSVGIAVDANVLIFERIREELDHGKTVRAAIDEGFKHAMSAIIDSNVSTILTAAVLYQFGTGPIQGFAVTLIAGIVASFVSAVFVTRTFFLLWLQRNRGAQQLSI